MAENLFLRFHVSDEVDGNRVEWMLLDESTGIIRFRGDDTPEEFSSVLRDLSWTGDLVVMIPTEDVLLTSATVPSKQQRQILQAVPFMVEEQLATDVEDCHFALGGRNADGSVQVAVVDLESFQTQVDGLKDMGITPDAMVPDVLLLPGSEDTSVFIYGERALVRLAGGRGFAVETSLLTTALGLDQEALGDTVTLHVHPTEQASVDLILAQLQAELTAEVSVVELEHGPFESLCRGYSGVPLNLLQGAFKVEKKKKSSAADQWRAVAILAVCAFGLHVSVLLGEGVFLDLQARELEGEARTLYAEVFPNERNVRDIRRRWRSHLGQADEGTAGFLSVFADTAKHIPGSNLTLNNVNYNESRGDVVLQLAAQRSEQIIAFSETLTSMGLESEVGTINQTEDGVRGSVKIKAVGGA